MPKKMASTSTPLAAGGATAGGARPKAVKKNGEANTGNNGKSKARANGVAKKQGNPNPVAKKAAAAQKEQHKVQVPPSRFSDESWEDKSDSEDDDNDYTEYTMNISEASPSPPATKAAPPKSLAARPTDRKRGAQNDANNNNNNKQPVKRDEISPAAVPRKQRRSLEQTAPVQEDGKAPYCPLVVRKSLPAGTVAKSSSSSLPKKRNTLAAAADEAKSCPLPAKAMDNEKPSTSKEAKSCPLPAKAMDNEKPSTSKQVKQQQQQQAIAEVPKNVHKNNSIEEGRRLLQWIMNPVKPDVFFSDFWEKNACLVQRKNPNFFSELISFRMIDEMLINNHLEFTTNIDVTSYTDGKRETLNPEGRAKPPTVWGFYSDGCSIRILNPSTYLPGLRQVCSMLQEFFHCLVGANVYLTPPNSQGFAPHFDDIEAFVLQIEGRKRWRLYMPLQPADVLARESSGNYSQEQLGEPVLDEVLEAGDILYFPRGTVHQAITEKDHHSLHITLSVYQQQAYANLMEHLMPCVLQRAVKQNLDMRRGLPLHTWQNMGLVHTSDNTRTRAQFVKEIQDMVRKFLVPTEKEIDWAVDQVAKKFQHEALPPTILPEEKVRTVFGSRSDRDEKGYSICDYEITEETSVRLLRANIIRLMRCEDSLRIYYYVDNALEYCKYEPNFMEIEAAEAEVIEYLIKAYPIYINVSMLPLKSADRRMEVATALWERGLLMTEKPFK